MSLALLMISRDQCLRFRCGWRGAGAVIGIELPNADRQTVLLRDIFDHDNWQDRSAALLMALGMDIAGHPVVADLNNAAFISCGDNRFWEIRWY